MRLADSHQLTRTPLAVVCRAPAWLVCGMLLVLPMDTLLAGEMPPYVVGVQDLKEGMRVVLLDRDSSGVLGRSLASLCADPRCIEIVPRDAWLGTVVTTTPADAEGRWKFIPEARPWVGYIRPPHGPFFDDESPTFVSPEAARVA